MGTILSELPTARHANPDIAVSNMLAFQASTKTLR